MLPENVDERSNGFDIVGKLSENERKEFFKPVDIIYRPVSKLNQTINYYFSESMRNAYPFGKKNRQQENNVMPVTNLF